VDDRHSTIAHGLKHDDAAEDADNDRVKPFNDDDSDDDDDRDDDEINGAEDGNDADADRNVDDDDNNDENVCAKTHDAVEQ